jgi:hypothetical protein
MTELSNRALNALRCDFGDAPDPSEVAKIGGRELLRTPGLGRVSLRIIEEWLASYGYQLANPPPGWPRLKPLPPMNAVADPDAQLIIDLIKYITAIEGKLLPSELDQVPGTKGCKLDRVEAAFNAVQEALGRG